MKIVLFCGPPGVKLTSRVENIAKYIEDNMENIGVKVYDIEDRLKNIIKQDKQEKLSSSEPDNLGYILRTLQLPRHYLEDKWERAVDEIFEEISKLQNNESSIIVFLVGHLIYYARNRDEFFHAVNPVFLNKKLEDSKLKIDRVVLLIDDIYDMVYNLDELWKADKLEKFDDTNLYLYPYSCIKTVLFWRYSESLTAQELARDLKTKFTVYAVKQGLIPLVNLILKDNSCSFYLSHPITNVKADKDEEFQREVVKLQNLFDRHGITLIMPTAIDELRIKQGEGLTDRWKLPESSDTWPLVGENIYEDREIKEYLEKKIFPNYKENSSLSKRQFFDEETIIESFKDDILRQIAFRDFQIIYSTEGILIYRPLYKGKNISKGVRHEIELVNKLNEQGYSRNIVIVNMKEDIDKFLKNIDTRNAEFILINTKEYIYVKEGKEPNNLKNFLKEGSGALSSVSQRGYDIESLKNELEEYKELFYKAFVHNVFHISPESQNSALILIFERATDFENLIYDIANWIRGNNHTLDKYKLYSHIHEIIGNIEQIIKKIESKREKESGKS